MSQISVKNTKTKKIRYFRDFHKICSQNFSQLTRPKSLNLKYIDAKSPEILQEKLLYLNSISGSNEDLVL